MVYCGLCVFLKIIYILLYYIVLINSFISIVLVLLVLYYIVFNQ